MPANAQQLNQANSYFHIYNEGRENRAIFNDQEDYSTFLKYLREYVAEPIDPKTIKKSFTVQGKTYHGVPHLPKNFFNKVVLLGYSLISNRFHLVLKQTEKGAVESFIRSLCTRYSIYYNKKYKRSGSLFDGPYKSVNVEGGKQLSLLVRYLHQMGGLSSIHQYINGGVPNWLANEPAINSYNDFLNNYALNSEDNKILDAVTFKHKGVEPIQLVSEYSPEPTVSEYSSEPKTINPDNPKPTKNSTKHLKPHQRYPELIFASTIFVFLFAFGFINVSTKNVIAVGSTPDVGQVAGVSIDSLEEVYSNSKKIIAIVKTTEAFVKVYSDMDLSSEIIGEAFDNDKYEISAKNNDWYEINLPYYQKGYVQSKYITETEIDAE